jgi:predicted AlkP superfamily pyrophosphatase or phosphodiesterase
MGNCAMRWFFLFSLVTTCSFAATPADRHVVIVVWDGMRPDFVTQEYTPTLWKFARNGVTFRDHHSIYPSATIVNGTAINTGVYPNHNGILANHVYRAEVDPRKSIDVESAKAVQKGDKLSDGKYVATPTLAEIIQQHGKHTAIAAAKTVGLLFDRHSDHDKGQDIFAGESTSPDAISAIVRSLGTFPPSTQPAERDNWTTKALTDFFWRDKIPEFSLLWLSEPDDTEHRTAPGAAAALAATKASDDNFERVLESLDRHHARDKTDIFVVSDHGFSTIERAIDLPKILKAAGFEAVTEFESDPKPGQIMLVGNGGTVLFYVIGHDARVTQRLVEFLQQWDFTGVIFTHEKIDGTFPFDPARIDDSHAPDVVMAFHWNENKNQFGVAGMIDADWQRAAGKGTHATLSKFDMHNTLIAAGPDFRRGWTDDLPSGNVDLAPTILAILGIKPPIPMDGRVLSEAMTKFSAEPIRATTEMLESTRKFPAGIWRQNLQLSRTGPAIYLDQGNGNFSR